MGFLTKVEEENKTEVYGALDSIKFNVECLFDGVHNEEDLHQLYMDIGALILALRTVREGTLTLEKTEADIGMTDYEKALDVNG